MSYGRVSVKLQNCDYLFVQGVFVIYYSKFYIRYEDLLQSIKRPISLRVLYIGNLPNRLLLKKDLSIEMHYHIAVMIIIINKSYSSKKLVYLRDSTRILKHRLSLKHLYI